jgi:hypothetical protein
MLPILSALCLALIAGLGGAEERGLRPSDELRLVDGRVLVGHVVQLEASAITLERNGRPERFLRSEVSELVSPLTLLEELADRDRAARSSGDARELMRWCLSQGLEREARLAALRLLGQDWDDGEARALYGGRAGDPRFRVRAGSLRLTQADLSAPSKRRERWLSTCFELSSDAAPLLTADAAFELQRAYGIWHERYGAVFGAGHARELSQVWLCARAADLPKEAAGRPGYYDHGTRRIVASAQIPDLGGLLRHEVGHQLLWAAWRSPDASPPPAWLDEGLAEHLACLCDGSGNRRRMMLERLSGGATPALAQLLSARSEQFRGPQGPELYAAAMLWIEFLETDAFKPDFWRWLTARASSAEPDLGSLSAALSRSLEQLELEFAAFLASEARR